METETITRPSTHPDEVHRFLWTMIRNQREKIKALEATLLPKRATPPAPPTFRLRQHP